jgi:hypothetical protein|tara:strand:- start:57 stop:368 length:312 start_codon:yes stop_codon:yes gene_type:complete
MAKSPSATYEKYLKNHLGLINDHLSVREYKRCPAEFPDAKGTFDKKKDIFIRIFWKKNPIIHFIVEKSFWYKSNSTKVDLNYMKDHADFYLNTIKNSLVRKKT